jgi:hypothetical protein
MLLGFVIILSIVLIPTFFVEALEEHEIDWDLD